MNQAIRSATSAAIGEAMDRQRPFSWLHAEPRCGNYARSVQCGVYVVYGQAHFQQYELPRRTA